MAFLIFKVAIMMDVLGRTVGAKVSNTLISYKHGILLCKRDLADESKVKNSEMEDHPGLLK